MFVICNKSINHSILKTAEAGKDQSQRVQSRLRRDKSSKCW